MDQYTYHQSTWDLINLQDSYTKKPIGSMYGIFTAYIFILGWFFMVNVGK